MIAIEADLIHNRQFVLNQFIRDLLQFLTLILIASLLFDKKTNGDFGMLFLFFLGAYIFKILVPDGNQHKANRIVVDDKTKLVTISYYNFVDGNRNINIPFKRFRYKTITRKKHGFIAPESIIFYKDNREIFELKSKKDNFSIDKIRELSARLDIISKPVRK